MNINSAASISPPQQPIDTYTAKPSEKMLSYRMFISFVRNRNHTDGAKPIAPPRKKNMPATRWHPALLTRNLVVLMSGSGLSEQQQVLHIPDMHSSKAMELSTRVVGRQNCRSRRSSWSTFEYHWKHKQIKFLLGRFETQKWARSRSVTVIPLYHSSNSLNCRPASHIWPTGHHTRWYSWHYGWR